jgi:tight adherence protein C
MFTIALTLSVFLFVTGAVLLLYQAVTGESVAAQRLSQLVPDRRERARGAAAAPRFALIKRVLSAFGRFGFGSGDKTLTQRLSAADQRGTNATLLFLGTRTLLSFGPALFFMVHEVAADAPLGRALMRAAGVWAIGHFGMNTWLKLKIRRRVRSITEALPDTLDLMVVCLEAGLGLDATIYRVGQERATMDDPLGKEFSQVAFELRSGRSRADALRTLGDRNGVEELKALAALIIQSDKLGASMGKTLRAHADLVRTQRRQRAEETARKLPIKILFPLATMILPALFIVILGPAFLKLKDLIKILTQ